MALDFVKSFYKEDKDGKAGHERTGNRLNFSKNTMLNVQAEVVSVELKTYSNNKKANFGEKYCLIKVRPTEVLEGNDQDIVLGAEYAIFFSFDRKTVAAFRADKEFEAFSELVADLCGESRQGIKINGQETIESFLTTCGEEPVKVVGTEYRFYNEPSGVDKKGQQWYTHHAEAL